MLIRRGMLLSLGLALLLGGSALGGAPAPVATADNRDAASEQNQGSTCFFRRDWDGHWTVTPDSRTIYIRVSHRWVYRLDLQAPDSLLQSSFAVLQDSGSNDSICGPLDFNLAVSDRTGVHEFPLVQRMTRLSSAEAAALPKKLRP